MSELRDKRIKFTKLICKLIEYANSLPDTEVALGTDFDEADPNEKRRHARTSLHYVGLANDVALYVGGKYQTSTDAYAYLGRYWKELDKDCRWGGDFGVADGNHFSLAFGGRS